MKQPSQVVSGFTITSAKGTVTIAQISFGQCLQQILRDRNCSIVQLQKKLGYKSATTVSRVLHDTSSPSLAERLLQQLLLTDFLSLSEMEVLALQQALLAGKGGLEQADAYEQLNKLFFASPTEEDVFFRDFTPAGERRYSFSQWLSGIQNNTPLRNLKGAGESFSPFEWAGGFQNIARIEGIFFGSFTPAMVRHFVSLASTLPEGMVHIRHFFEVGTDALRLANLLLSLRSVFLCPWYEAYFNTVEENTVDSSPAFLHNMAVFRFETKQNQVASYEMHLTDETELFMWRHIGSDLPFTSMTAIAESFDELKRYRPARKELMENHSLEDLIVLYRRLYFMERERMMRIIMPSIPLSFIPLEIMLRHAHHFIGQAASARQDLLKPFVDLHTARYENNYKKKKPSYIIMSKEALKRFADEGVLYDHPHGFPPFTREERRSILNAFVKNCRDNPYFHAFMAHESFLFGDTNYCCFASLGLHLCQSNVHYQAEAPILEVAMVIEGILRLFENYYDEELLKRYTDSEASSLAFLEDLLEGLQGPG